MRISAHQAPAAAERTAWGVTLVAASIICSCGFACAAPLAAFAAATALTRNRREAVALLLVVFLANQAIGFAALHYPWEATTVGWGIALGLASIAALFGAAWAKERLSATAPVFRVSVGFLAAFAIFEGILLAAAVLAGSGFGAFAPLVVARIFAINVAAFVALMALRQLAVSAGLFKIAPASSAAKGPAYNSGRS